VQSSKPRVLFVAEDLTVAQIVRLVALARRLDPAVFDVHFACRDFDPLLFAGTAFERARLFSIDKVAGLKRLAKGDKIYDAPTLGRYVEDELQLFAEVRPDLVVGDFRLSLPISCARARVPCATLINAYWSPYAIRDAFPVPEHPIVNLVGPERAARYMPQALPKAFAYFAAPLNVVHERYGLPPLGMLEQLTAGDFVLYPDVPELCPTQDLPAHHLYLGAVEWSPELELPGFFAELDREKPLIYVTLGSSGALEALPVVIEALADLPLEVVISSAGRTQLSRLPANVRAVDYLPGQAAARQAALVITNGGSSTGYQALLEAVPVLGIAFNMDQYLAMTAIEKAGAGLLLRTGGLRPEAVRKAVLRLLDDARFRHAASKLQAAFAKLDCHERFASVLARALDPFTSGTSGSKFPRP